MYMYMHLYSLAISWCIYLNFKPDNFFFAKHIVYFFNISTLRIENSEQCFAITRNNLLYPSLGTKKDCSGRKIHQHRGGCNVCPDGRISERSAERHEGYIKSYLTQTYANSRLNFKVLSSKFVVHRFLWIFMLGQFTKTCNL